MNKEKNNKLLLVFIFLPTGLIMLVVFMIMLLPRVENKDFIESTKRKLSIAKIVVLENAIQHFYLDCDRYPNDSNGLNELINCPSALEKIWKGPYVKQNGMFDGWENPYIYIRNGIKDPNQFELISYGADGVPGGEGYNADIFNN